LDDRDRTTLGVDYNERILKYVAPELRWR